MRAGYLSAIAIALVAALCLAAATPASAAAKGAASLAAPDRHAIPAAKPKRCKARKVRVLLNGKPKCFTAAALRNGAPGANVVDMLIRATAKRGLWRKRGHPSVYKPLTRGGRARLLTAERALYATSRSVGRPLLPFDPGTGPAGKRADGGVETLGLEVPGWLDPKRQQEIREAVSGVQTVEATTSGSKTMKPPDSNDFGEYEMKIKEKFEGDPCPDGKGLVVGIATFIVQREASFPRRLRQEMENVGTISVTFKAVVNKRSTIDSYELLARLDSAEGGWSGSVRGKKLSPTAPIFVLVDLDDFTIHGPTGLDAKSEGHLGAATVQALVRAKDEVDKWLKQAQAIFKDRAKCNKVQGDGGQLKRGQEKTVNVKVGSIRGPTTDGTVKLEGRNGLEIVGSKEVKTGKNGKVQVKVRGGGRFLAGVGAAPPYELAVEGVSELGRAVGTVTFEGLPERISGTFSGSETRTIPGVGDSSATFSGTVTFVRTEASFDPSSATYEVEQLNYTTTATISGGGCSGSATDSASFGRQDQAGTLTLAYEETPGKGQAYEILVDAERTEPGSMTVNCPTGSHDVEWAVAASLTTGGGSPYYTDGTTFRGTYSAGAGTTFTCTWDLKGSD